MVPCLDVSDHDLESALLHQVQQLDSVATGSAKVKFSGEVLRFLLHGR